MNFWKTVEVDCWSRDFDYADYVAYHAVYLEKGLVDSEPLSEVAYMYICKACEYEFEKDCGND